MQRKKGTTILEMVIVLAVTSIISIMVVSFASSADSWISLGTDRLNLITEEEQFASVFQKFCETYDRADYKFEVIGGKLCAKKGSTVFELEYEEYEVEDNIGKVDSSIFMFEEYEKDSSPEEQVKEHTLSTSMKCQYIEAISFNVETDATGQQLIICRCFYNLGSEYEDRNMVTGTYVKAYATVVPKAVSGGAS